MTVLIAAEACWKADLSSRLPFRGWTDNVDGETWHWHGCQHPGSHQQHLWEELRHGHSWATTQANDTWNCSCPRLSEGQWALFVYDGFWANFFKHSTLNKRVN